MEENKKYKQMYQDTQDILKVSQQTVKELRVRLDETDHHDQNASILSELQTEQNELLELEQHLLNNSNLEPELDLKLNPLEITPQSPEKNYPSPSKQSNSKMEDPLNRISHPLESLPSPIKFELPASPKKSSETDKPPSHFTPVSLSDLEEMHFPLPRPRSSTHSHSVSPARPNPPPNSPQDVVKALEKNRYIQRFHTILDLESNNPKPLFPEQPKKVNSSSSFTDQEIATKVNEFRNRSANYLDRQNASSHPLSEASLISQDELDLLNKLLTSAESRIKANEFQLNKLRQLVHTKSIKEGWMSKKGTFFWRKRWFILAGAGKN